MSNWRCVRHTSDGHSAAEELSDDLAWFVDDPAATESWAYGYPVPGADERAARAWAATAHAAAQAVGTADVVVVGEGVLARLVRLALPDPAPTSSPRREVAVETTGTTVGIRGALEAVSPGGRVLLAARPLGAMTPLATYHAVHLPGIRVLPIPWCGGTGDPPAHLLERALSSLTS